MTRGTLFAFVRSNHQLAYDAERVQVQVASRIVSACAEDAGGVA